MKRTFRCYEMSQSLPQLLLVHLLRQESWQVLFIQFRRLSENRKPKQDWHVRWSLPHYCHKQECSSPGSQL